MISKERWVEVEGFPRYLISNLGRVQNKITGRILKQGYTPRGYPIISLCSDGYCISKLIHTLVVSGFIGKISDDMTVNHIDGYKINNVVENLEIITNSENLKHAYENGLKGSWQNFKRVRCIETNEIFESSQAVARIFNVPPSSISRALHHQKPIHGYTLELVD